MPRALDSVDFLWHHDQVVGVMFASARYRPVMVNLVRRAGLACQACRTLICGFDAQFLHWREGYGGLGLAGAPRGVAAIPRRLGLSRAIPAPCAHILRLARGTHSRRRPRSVLGAGRAPPDRHRASPDLDTQLVPAVSLAHLVRIRPLPRAHTLPAASGAVAARVA